MIRTMLIVLCCSFVSLFLFIPFASADIASFDQAVISDQQNNVTLLLEIYPDTARDACFAEEVTRQVTKALSERWKVPDILVVGPEVDSATREASLPAANYSMWIWYTVERQIRFEADLFVCVNIQDAQTQKTLYTNNSLYTSVAPPDFSGQSAVVDAVISAVDLAVMHTPLNFRNNDH